MSRIYLRTAPSGLILYELASQLIDPDYGCPTENLAILAMHKHLQRTSNGLH